MKYRLTETGAFQTELEYGTLTISGNSELGFRPFQLLVSSIAGCSGSVFRKFSKKRKLLTTISKLMLAWNGMKSRQIK